MLDLEWRATAVADLMAIVDYISDDNPEAAQALKDDIESKVSRLPENPRICRVGRVDGTREMVVRSNYIVVYNTLSPFYEYCTVPSSGRRREDRAIIYPRFPSTYQNAPTPYAILAVNSSPIA